MTQEQKKMNQGLDNQEDKEREDEKEEKEPEKLIEHYEDLVDDALLGIMDDVDEEDG